MKTKITEEKIKQLKDNGINFARYKNFLIIYNDEREKIITENLLKVNVKIVGKTIVLDRLDLIYLFDKFEVYAPLTLADYNVALNEDELVRKILGISGEIGDEIWEDKPLRMALNYYINNKHDGDCVYNTSRIFHNYSRMVNQHITGFHFPRQFISEKCKQLKIENTLAYHTEKPYDIIKEEDRTIILSENSDDLSQINGVITPNDTKIKYHELIGLGKLYDIIYSSNRVAFGYKFNAKPNEYEMANPYELLSKKRLNIMDMQTYDFTPRGLGV
jgi:hypothetical protein